MVKHTTIHNPMERDCISLQKVEAKMKNVGINKLLMRNNWCEMLASIQM